MGGFESKQRTSAVAIVSELVKELYNVAQLNTLIM